MRILLVLLLSSASAWGTGRSVSVAPMRFGDYQFLTPADNPLSSSKILSRQFDFVIVNTGSVPQTVTVTVTMGTDAYADATNPASFSNNALTPQLANMKAGSVVAWSAAAGATTSYTGSVAAGKTEVWAFQVQFKGKNYNSNNPATFSYGGSITAKIAVTEDPGSIMASISSHSEWSNLSNPPDFTVPLATQRNVWRDYPVLGGHAF